MRKSQFKRKWSGMIFSGIASLGVLSTAILAIKATPKALAKIEADSLTTHGDAKAYTRKEAIESAWRFYIPAAGSALATIACIVFATAESRRSQQGLIAAYGLLKNSFDRYKNKVINIYGKEGHAAIEKAIQLENRKDVTIYACDCVGTTCLDMGDFSEGEVVRTFYDSLSNRYFESTLEAVIQAEYHLNRNFALGMEVSANMFYEFLGLETHPMYDEIGWTVNDDYYWIDFSHELIILDDDMEICVINMVNSPTASYLEC